MKSNLAKISANLVTDCVSVPGHGYAPRGPRGPIYDNSYADIFRNESECMQAVTGQKKKLICSGARTHWAIFRISDSARLLGNANGFGERVLSSCIRSITDWIRL